jgi:formamidopyrimidine-DNA glycosylase
MIFLNKEEKEKRHKICEFCDNFDKFNEKCKKCGTLILKIKHASRGTHYGPICQK